MKTRSLVSVLGLVLALLVIESAVRAQPVPPVIPQGWTLVDDMILPEDVVSGDSVYYATAWPGGTVPYVFDANTTATMQAQAKDAMAEWAAVANVTYVARTNQANYIRFRNSTGNSSNVGVIGGVQDVNIASWNSRYVICHELNHALGYDHEQCRPDRNTYVTVNGNYSAANAPNFQILSAATATTVGAYDFLSIMHYPRTAFSNNGNDSITCLPAYAAFQNLLGNRTYMTALDAQGCAARYGAPNPPAIFSMSCSAVAGTANTVLSLFGSRFFRGSPNASGVQGSRVEWNGVALPTTFLSPTNLTATVPANLLATPGVVSITVRNPTPGGGVSAAGLFNVAPATGPVPGAAVIVGTGYGSGPAPLLGVNQPPTISQPVTVTMSNLLPNVPGILVVGLALPAPVQLLPGCFIHVDINNQYLLLPVTTDANGAASLTFGIPCAPLIIGQTYMGQAAAADPLTALGLAVTNGVRVTIGG